MPSSSSVKGVYIVMYCKGIFLVRCTWIMPTYFPLQCSIVNELLRINKVSTPYWTIRPAVRLWNTDCRIVVHHHGKLSSYFYCLPSRSVLTYIEYTDMSVYNTTIYFIYFKIVYRQGDIFRPSLGHPQALKENGSKTTYIFFTKTHCGIPNAYIMF